ncbi:MAG: hypothetical protein ABI841_02675 [Chloroflexota bacterium]
MDDEPALLYLEADDEVTTVVRRLRATTEPRVVVVAPGRSRATSSVVALRLLARVAGEEGREIAVVGDALTRSLAAEAGIPAYLSVDDARRAGPVDPSSSPPRRAGIHVVRGRAAEETAPTLATAAIPATDGAWAETRSHPAPVARTASPRPGRLERRFPLMVAAGVLGVLLLATGVAGVILLPAATATIVPAVRSIPPRTYTLTLAGPADGAVRRTGTAEELGTVTATGTYPIREQAAGTVVFFNYNVSAQDVQAGTLVAANEQAFATVTPVIVPEGRLTPQGTILAGEASVSVMAVAPGQAGNVAAGAIDTVLSEGPRNGLRGFADNESGLVTNPNATSRGDERTGSEILQVDVDAAVAALQVALVAEFEEAMGNGDVIRVPVGTPLDVAFEGLEGLVGMRDQPPIEIRGSLPFDVWLVDRAALERAAAERLGADRDAVPDGFRLLSGPTVVEVTGTLGTPDGVEASVAVSGRAVADVEAAAVIERIRGLTPDEAEAALSDIGQARVEVWPDWVTTVTEVELRVRVIVETAESEAPAAPSGAASPSASATP